MLYSRCPMCGSEHKIIKVASYKLGSSFKLCGMDENGYVCCSYDDYRFRSREHADRVAATWGRAELEQLDHERQDEARAYGDDQDYGPVDSDPYDN
jgi:hypothetical protein